MQFRSIQSSFEHLWYAHIISEAGGAQKGRTRLSWSFAYFENKGKMLSLQNLESTGQNDKATVCIYSTPYMDGRNKNKMILGSFSLIMSQNDRYK